MTNSKRSFIIEKIIATIIKCEKKSLIIDEDKFIREISAEYYCSHRTAKEYLESARQRYNQLNIYIDNEN